MNKVSSYIVALAAVGMLSACSEIDEADRYLEMPEVDVQRAVLIEEFTGQSCTNCPTAQRQLSEIKAQYGEQLVVVSIHAGSFGLAESVVGPYGLMQPEGNEYASHWAVERYPSAVVNRATNPLAVASWASSIRSEMEKPSGLDIILSASLVENEDGDSVVTVKAELQPSVAASGRLQLWITESNIVGYQVDGTKVLLDYVHNHVYRASVNGIWGEDVVLEPNIYQSAERTAAIKEHWNTDNLAVVGFVYNDAGVLQVAECKVVKETEN